MNIFSRTRFLVTLLVIATVGVTGCSDSLMGVDTEAPAARQEAGKMRLGHLMSQAQSWSASSGHHAKGDLAGPKVEILGGDQLNLIIGLNDFSVDKQRLLTRYKLLTRYRLLTRYDYDDAFAGLAVTITDETGTGDFSEFFAELNSDPDIAWYEPDVYVATPIMSDNGSSTTQKTPWSVAMIGGERSWTVSGDGQGTVDGVDVYVLDTGVAKASTGDPDDDLHLRSNVDFRSNLLDDAVDYDGHGTHIAGIIGAVDDNDGLVGVAPGINIHNFKVLDDDGTTDVSVVIAALEHLIDIKEENPSKAMVVNLSLGADVGTEDYTALDYAVRAAYQAGIVIVAAAGNYGIDARTVTPAHASEAITVGSYGPNSTFSPFSNHGPAVDLLAPGEGVVSLAQSIAGVEYKVTMSGTSMAAAHVTGAAALYLARQTSASPGQVRDALVGTGLDFVSRTPRRTTNRSVWVGQ